MTVRRSILILHLLVATYGLTGVVASLINASGVTLAVYRAFFASVFFIFYFLFFQRKTTYSWDNFKLSILSGLLNGIYWAAFFVAIKMSNVSTAVVGFSAVAFIAAVVEPALEKKPIAKIQLGLALVVALGLQYVYEFSYHNYQLISVSLGGALATVLSSIVSKKIVFSNDGDPRIASALETLGSLIIVTIIALVLREPIMSIELDAFDWLWILVLSGPCTAFAYTVSIWLYKYIDVFTMQLHTSFEAIYGVVLASLILQEYKSYNSNFYIGFILIALAIGVDIALRFRSRSSLESDQKACQGSSNLGSQAPGLSPRASANEVSAQDPQEKDH